MRLAPGITLIVALVGIRPALAADRTTAGAFIVEPPTLLSLG